MIPQKYLDVLDELNTEAYKHTLGSLKNHLVGTYNLLIEWGNPEYIALGGLFHSIYGTQVYRIQSTSLDNRPYLREIIGPKAEELAYLFCVTDRKGFCYEADKETPVLWDAVHEKLIAISPQTIRDLIEIEAANKVDQHSPSRKVKQDILSRRKHMLARGRKFMSTHAQVALARVVEETQVVLPQSKVSDPESVTTRLSKVFSSKISLRQS